MTLLSLSALLAACGDDSTADPQATEQKADAGGARHDSTGTKADAGGKPTSSGSAVVYTGTPTCDETGLHLLGSVDGNAIDEVRMLSSAVRLETSLRTRERNYDVNDYDGSDENLNISWDTALTKGKVSTIGEGSVRFPMLTDVGPYCVDAGKIGFDPMQPSEGSRIQFTITSVRKMEGDSCTGAELPADLKGCVTLFGVNQD